MKTKRLTQNEAGAAIRRGEKVFAVLDNGRVDRIRQIQFLAAIGERKSYRIEDEIQYFFQYLETIPLAT